MNSTRDSGVRAGESRVGKLCPHHVDGAADAGDGHDAVRLCREDDLLVLLDQSYLFLGGLRNLLHQHREKLARGGGYHITTTTEYC